MYLENNKRQYLQNTELSLLISTHINGYLRILKTVHSASINLREAPGISAARETPVNPAEVKSWESELVNGAQKGIKSGRARTRAIIRLI